MKTTIEIFKYIVEEIHSTIAATVDENNLPVTCAINMMHYDETGIYFFVSKGMSFYEILKNRNYLSFTAMDGKGIKDVVYINVSGNVEEIDKDRKESFFSKNEYVNRIYPTEKSRMNMTVFKIVKGKGEWIDLRKRPIERYEFSFGGEKLEKKGYFVTEKCLNCGRCREVCPQNCIEIEKLNDVKQSTINHVNCINCGNCADICPVEAILKRI